MKEILERLYRYETLSYQEAKRALQTLMTGSVNASHIASFMTVFLMRRITVEELLGFRDVMLENCLRVPLEEYQVIDVCGTGGDGKNTFNISTTAAFVVAGAGICVAKHGNYGVSSVCGSSNVLEYFGYAFTNDVDKLRKQIEKAKICFMHAPLFHPAMKTVAPIRKEMGLKTFFNMLGPMVNPAFPSYQFVGVFSLELARLYEYLYQRTSKKYAIVHSLDTYDEISLTTEFKWITPEGERVISPSDLGMPYLLQEQLVAGSTVEDSARIVLNVLEGKASEAQQNVVIANAAGAIRTVFPSKSWQEAIYEARESLLSKRAFKAFQTLLAC
ncbi:MAG: anthranilate phosphoribosyltransferase [Cytophagales bacterium]|nr:anthranilate phosphoribosyltransferase [Cytophagales bacterium]MDW8385017.1 anthranilate phosphoribosyltransferase [Flammeovirgaceae bacterium]